MSCCVLMGMLVAAAAGLAKLACLRPGQRHHSAQAWRLKNKETTS